MPHLPPGSKKNVSPSSFKRSITLLSTPPSFSVKTNPPFQHPSTHNELSSSKTNLEKTTIDNNHKAAEEANTDVNNHSKVTGSEDAASETTYKTDMSRESINKVYDEFDGVVCGLFPGPSATTTHSSAQSHSKSHEKQSSNQTHRTTVQQQSEQHKPYQQQSEQHKPYQKQPKQYQQQPKPYKQQQQQHSAPLSGQGSMGTNSLVHYFEQTRKYNIKDATNNFNNTDINNSNNIYKKMTSVPADTTSLEYHWRSLNNKTSNNDNSEENRGRQTDETTKTKRQLMDKEWEVLQFKETIEKMKKEHDVATKEHEKQMMEAQKRCVCVCFLL